MFIFSRHIIGSVEDFASTMHSIVAVYHDTKPTKEKSIGDVDIDEQDAIRKVEDAKMRS